MIKSIREFFSKAHLKPGDHQFNLAVDAVKTQTRASNPNHFPAPGTHHRHTIDDVDHELHLHEYATWKVRDLVNSGTALEAIIADQGAQQKLTFQ